MKLVVVDDVSAERNSILARLQERGVEAVSIDLVHDVSVVADRIGQVTPDCALLDFVLNESGVIKYRSHVLARLLRDRAIDATGPEIPIVLYSSAPNFKQFYEPDQTSHDLYDFRFDKEEMQSEIDEAVDVLEGLAAAYRLLAGTSRDLVALNNAVNKPDGIEIDPRFGDRFPSIRRYPLSELVGYTIRELIGQPDPLIDEELLTARLGLDRLSSSSIRKLLNALSPASIYSGICARGFERWWWQPIDTWLDSISNGTFRSMPAEDRVALLSKELNIEGLRPALPICDDYQTSYWSVCEASRRPVDLADAFIASNSSREPWHDHRYISIDAALRRAGEECGVVVDSSDQERYLQVKELLGA